MVILPALRETDSADGMSLEYLCYLFGLNVTPSYHMNIIWQACYVYQSDTNPIRFVMSCSGAHTVPRVP